MAIDPSISLGVRPPVIQPLQIQNPLEQYGKILSLRNLMTEQQSGQLGLQAQQLKMQEAQKQIQEEDAVRKLYAQNPTPTDAELVSTIGPVRAAALIKAKSEQYQQQLKTNQEKAARLGQIAGSAVDAPSYQNAIMTAVSENLIPADHGRQLSALDWNDPKTQAQVKQFQQQAMTAVQQHDALIADAKAKQGAAESAAKLPGVQADAAQKLRLQNANILAAAAARGPEALNAAIALLPAEQQAPFLGAGTAKEVMQRALTPEQFVTAGQAADTAAETMRQHAAENAVSQAHLNIARRADARAEQVYQNTYGPGANEALVGVDPKLRVQATTNAQKAADEYSKAVESTGNMQSIIDLARSGNKVAYAYAPTTGVLTINTAQGVKRVNMPEIKSYGGAGSAMDQIEGWFGKQTSGASIPADILKSMEEVNKSISDSAAKNYDTKLGSINQNYHANFKPSVKAATSGGTATAPHGGQYKAGDTRVIDGRTYTRDANGNWK
jgi:hypothetical protein